MRRLARAIDGLDEPAVEKIAKDQQEDAFQVLIATMLSAQTRDAVTAAASSRLFRVARTPASMAKLSEARIQELIYPVSFYRHKAVHVRQTCEQILSRFSGRVPPTGGRWPAGEYGGRGPAGPTGRGAWPGMAGRAAAPGAPAFAVPAGRAPLGAAGRSGWRTTGR